jgi:hypothetical protein
VEQEKEAHKRTWRRGPRDRGPQSKPWTLKEYAGKTVWDWLQLLIVPVMLLLITVAFTWQQNNRQEAIEEQRAQDLALQGYLDQMGTLMLEDLSDPKVQTLARARTLTVLGRLDPSRVCVLSSDASMFVKVPKLGVCSGTGKQGSGRPHVRCTS